MRIQPLIFATAGLTLAACTTHPVDRANGNWISYTCSDGQVVKASYPDSDTALLDIKGELQRLHIAISGSGARYIGGGWQWWTKGMHEGRLAPLGAGEEIASAAGVDCRAD